MKLHRIEYVYAGTELVDTIHHDIDWKTLPAFRARVLEASDKWYLKDRWDSLSSTAKGQLNSYRQSLRDLPQDFPGEKANEAVDNWPDAEEWF